MPLGTTNNLIETHSEPDIREIHPYWYACIDLVDYLRSRWRAILLWGLAGLLLAAPIAWRICRYTAVVQLMPPDSSGGGGLASLALPSIIKSPGLAGLSGLAGDLLGVKSTGALFQKVLTSHTVEDNLINRFDLRRHFHLRLYEDTRLKLEKRTTISEDKKSGVIAITVSDLDPQFAAALANGYVEELDQVMRQVATSAARREREFIEQRLAQERNTLEDAEQKFSHYSSSSMTLDVPQQTRVMVEASARLQGELIAARSELEGLTQIYTPENTRVKTVQAKINELERDLARLNTGGAQGNGRSSAADPYPSIKNLPLVGLEWTDLYRNMKIHETVFELLTQQYEVARIQEARELPVVKVLDKATPPEKRHPDYGGVVMIGALVGMGLACIGLLLQRSWNSWDPADPRRILIGKFWPGSTER